ncbi:prepilin-type N-terminal cleavage/methylation domain-containing protein [Methylophilus sp. VKM B-3414]|uniref:type II secretion system protein n=1 Tax=Methylophilus sp. VKM B-3414 TaxID=3076121 RepID=UPI0028C91697|nr:prepilin-type N-terminal cleavage/methylation domain-containing protein [Methylophilus sp. VKM B-3414]MDT7848912.1 prepilin-type N-terminal cleavage/methylation domain-containing protein [Methylophilus sp. VKM B-3414]
MKTQQGFTLIELAIVLVIAGLLLAGVMRGQELIANAKVKSLASDFRNIPTYFYGYQDRFRVLPGDDHAADIHVNGTNATTTGQTQNGLIQGAWNSNTDTDESFLIWQHLRLAGLATGSTDPTSTQYVPRNSEGGQLGVSNVTALTAVTAGAFSSAHAMCSDAILGRYAAQLDTMLDDGVGNTGAMRVVVNGTPSAGVATPLPGTSYLVCMSF